MTDAGAIGSRFQLLDDEQILAEPRLTYLVDGIFTLGAFILVHGESNAGKTFVVLDLSLCIASGVPWHGHEVMRGPVVYIAAEGHAGLRNRVRAWKKAHRMERRALGVRFVRSAVNPLDPAEMALLQCELSKLDPKPVLIVVDTWSASLSAGGGDEDKAKDAGRAAAAWRALADACDATVLVIHHEGVKGRGRARGSSALRATTDTEIAIKSKRGVVTLQNPKQRDIEPFPPMSLQLQSVPLGESETSCVLVTSGAPDHGEPAPDELGGKAAEALATLDRMPNHAATYSDWQKASGQKPSTFDRSRDELVATGRVTKDGEGQGVLYRVAGNHPHDPQTTTNGTNGGDPKPPPPTLTPLRGESGGGEGSVRSSEVRALDFSDVSTSPMIPIPFGEYKGETVADVPDEYLRWLVRRSNISDGLRDAIEGELASRAREEA